jgi:AhpD family alkylhydroperoxidase
MALTIREKEIAAVGISVAAGCKPCTSYHQKAAAENGASDAEIRQAVAGAVAIRRRASEIMERHGLRRTEGPAESSPTAEPTRTGELTALGAAYAVRCPSSLKQHLKAADLLGVGADEIREVVQLAAFIQEMAASHVERLVPQDAEGPDQMRRPASCQ